MSPPNQLPTSMRYVKARLRILKRPMVWGSMSVLLLTIFLFAQYWNNPEWFISTGEGSNRSPSSGVASIDNLNDPTQYQGLPSREDSAIGADIDSLPVLLNDFDDPSQPPQGDRLGAEDQSQDSGTLRQLQRPAPPPAFLVPDGASTTVQNPLVNQKSSNTETTLFNSAITGTGIGGLFDMALPSLLSGVENPDSSGQPDARNNPAINNPFTSSINTVPTLNLNSPLPSSPLRESLQRRSLSQSERTVPPTQTDPLTTAPALSNPQRATLQPPSPLQTSPYTGYYPQMAPPPGTTGYVLPPTLRSVPSSAPGYSYQNPSLNQGQIQPLAPSVPATAPYGQPTYQVPTYRVNQGYTVPNGNQGYGVPNSYNAPAPNYTNQAPQAVPVEPAPLPFTAPYSRGGGEFNTFSNP